MVVPLLIISICGFNGRKRSYHHPNVKVTAVGHLFFRAVTAAITQGPCNVAAETNVKHALEPIVTGQRRS